MCDAYMCAHTHDAYTCTRTQYWAGEDVAGRAARRQRAVHGKLVRAMTRLLERVEALRRRKCQRYTNPSRVGEDTRTINGDMTHEHTSLAPPATPSTPLWADGTVSKRRAVRPDLEQRGLDLASMASPPTAAGVHASQNVSRHVLQNVSHHASQRGALGSPPATQTKTGTDPAAPGGGGRATFTGNTTATTDVAGGNGIGEGLVSTPPAARRMAWKVWPRVAQGNTRPHSSSFTLNQ